MPRRPTRTEWTLLAVGLLALTVGSGAAGARRRRALGDPALRAGAGRPGGGRRPRRGDPGHAPRDRPGGRRGSLPGPGGRARVRRLAGDHPGPVRDVLRTAVLPRRGLDPAHRGRGPRAGGRGRGHRRAPDQAPSRRPATSTCSRRCAARPPVPSPPGSRPSAPSSPTPRPRSRKVWLLRHELQGVPLPAGFLDDHPEARATAAAPALGREKRRYPRKAKVMRADRTNAQSHSWWCGPATMQMIAWGWRHDREPQRYWADKLGTTTDGSAITSIVRLVNRKTGYDSRRRAGPYVVLDISDLGYRRWFRLTKKHIADYRAPAGAAPRAAVPLLPLPRRRRVGALPGRPRLQGQAQRHREDRLLRALEPAGASTRPSRSSTGSSGAAPTAATAPTWRTRCRTWGSERVRSALAAATSCAGSSPQRAARPTSRTAGPPAETADDHRPRPARARARPHRDDAVRVGEHVGDRPVRRRRRPCWPGSPRGRPVEETVTAGGGWTVVVDQERSLATVDGPRSVRHRRRQALPDLRGAARHRLAGRRAQRLAEERPDVATVVDLTTGDRSDRDRTARRSRPPPAAPGRSRAACSCTPPSAPIGPTASPAGTWPPAVRRRRGARHHGTASRTPGSPRPASA